MFQKVRLQAKDIARGGWRLTREPGVVGDKVVNTVGFFICSIVGLVLWTANHSKSKTNPYNATSLDAAVALHCGHSKIERLNTQNGRACRGLAGKQDVLHFVLFGQSCR